MRLTTSQNALHFGMKCSKLCRFLGLRPRPRWGAYDAPPYPLVGRGFLPSEIAHSRLRRLQFPPLACLYAKTEIPESQSLKRWPPWRLQHLDFCHLQYVPLLEIS